MGTAPGTEGFAALLRTLKTRSGLSYGALAKRLHMSTSTLHRYCNGDAVPTDYAPVERLARVCGAQSEELVELHRRWILADAARGRRGAEEPGTAGAATAAAASKEPAPDNPVPEKAVPVEPAPEKAVPEEAVPVEPTPEPVPGAETATDAPSGAAPAPESAPESAPAPTPVATPAHPTRPKLRLALAAAAVVALAVPVVVLGTTSSSGPDRTRPADAQVADRAAGGRGPVPDGGASAMPSASASGATGTPAPDRTPAAPAPSGDAKPSGEGKGEAGGSSGRTSGTPLTVDVRTNNWDDPCDRWYMLDKPPTEVPPPPSGPDARGWANALGAVPGGHLRVSLAVQGTGDEAVVLHSLTVRTTARTASAAGSAYSMGNGCGGGLTPASFDVGLDAAQPRTRPVAGEQGDRKIPATDFPFKVSASDPQMLYVDAHAAANDVSWYLELEWSSGGRRGTLRLDDHGRPFRTSAMKGRPAYLYRYDQNVWEPTGN
ncbi:helix-turn-helix domain-containing protein [Streptomyces sp. NPDC018019]|uniref:helix-turn-helix domain-containing protein n=1 Tax=Streptomyces sp. NPDC018019 TaxID=3365030 RepID=UPI0037A5D875